MIPQIFSIAAAFIFLLIGVLHIYWAMGGKWGFRAAVPQIEGKPAFSPPPVLTLAVALGLLGMGGLALVLEFVTSWGELAWVRGIGMAVAGIFLLRAIGDFRMVGFFKSASDTLFARNDTRLYAPLCLFLSLSFIAMLWL